MGEEIASQNNIKIEKKFFGLISSATFEPTGSKIDGYQLYISRKANNLVYDMMDATEVEQLDHLLEKGKKVEYNSNGNEMLDVCMSRDHKFVALQRFCYENYLYQKATEVKYFEAEKAEKVAELLGL